MPRVDGVARTKGRGGAPIAIAAKLPPTLAFKLFFAALAAFAAGAVLGGGILA